ncbi:MAG: TRAP transporter small permease [Lachnospiraceae bacterium]|jgi:TRAP-type C4-dicarboxylate transport system permease small subunit|nr:TRAP transporter small permease [Lachnospiraceae bacterium]
MKWLKAVYGFLCRAEEAAAMICLLGATIILCAGALCRIMGFPLAMISEIALCLFAWCVFLGADAAYRKNKLVYVELVIDGAGPKWKRILYGINYSLIFVFLVFFTIQSWHVVFFSWVRKWASIPILSYGWVALSIPVGCTLMLITTAIQFHSYVIKGEHKVSETESLLMEDDFKTEEKKHVCSE